MKRFVSVLMAALLVLAMASTAMAADTTTKILGQWEVEFPGYGLFTIDAAPDGIGRITQQGNPAGEFAFMLRESTMVSAELGEDSVPVVESATLLFPDENTIQSSAEGESATFKRVGPAAADRMTLSNPFIGTWLADLPEVAGMVMSYNPDGTYDYKGGEFEGNNSYFVFQNLMVSMDDSGAYEIFSFEVVDQDTLKVTDQASGESAVFTKVA